MPRFQFSLKTLLIVVTLVGVACAYVAHEAKTIRDREAMIEWLGQRKFLTYRPKPAANWLRRLLGGRDVETIWTPPRGNPSYTDDERRSIRRLFPEAVLADFYSDQPVYDP